MNAFAAILLAALSVWDYPARQPRHDELKAQFVVAVREGDTETMVETCRKGVELLPEDPTWAYNLACSLAYFKDPEPALDALENAIDLGFRDANAIANDNDLKRIKDVPRFKELVEYAKDMARRPIYSGPLANVPATGVFGKTVTLGEQNVVWDFESGCFDAKMSLGATSFGGNTGDLYMNRDGGHSVLVVTNWPGLTAVKLDAEGRSRGLDLDFPNILFPYPVFGNCSRALTLGPYWRSLPRALVTSESRRLNTMVRFYLSNQIWCFPTVNDVNSDTNWFGDVFMSVTPYWFATKGASWSDQYYLKAALEASRSFPAKVKSELVRTGMLAPTIQTLVRKSLRNVHSEEDYLTSKAHPTAFPPNGLDLQKLKKTASSLKIGQIPPLARIAFVAPEKVPYSGSMLELTYATPFAWAFILRADAPKRGFVVKASGGEEYAFAQVHGSENAVEIVRLANDTAKITVDKSFLSPTSRVDLAVFAKKAKTGWGAPSFISFAAVDPEAPYSDPVFTVLPEPATEQ